MRINSLQSLRYFITWPSNESQLRGIQQIWRGQVIWNMQPTYQQLIDSHTQQLQARGASAQIQRNHLTALNRFMHDLKRARHQLVGDELSQEAFASSLEKHLAGAQLSPRSTADRRSILRDWQQSYIALVATQQTTAKPQPSRRERRRAAVEVPQNPFERLLKQALADARLAPKRAALLCQISTSAMGRWTRGALPNARSTDAVSKLNTLLGLTPGSLENAWQEALEQAQPALTNPYRERLKMTTKSRMRLPSSNLEGRLGDEWRALLLLKTGIESNDPTTEPTQHWNLVMPTESTHKPSRINTVGRQLAPSADIAWAHISSYLGYLQLPKERGGAAVLWNDAPSLAWLAVPELVESYLHCMFERAGGLRHGGHAVFCSQVASLLRPSAGFLVCRPELVQRLDISVLQGRTWHELCEQTHRLVKRMHRQCTHEARDPSLPIRTLLNQEEALLPVLAAVKRLRHEATLFSKDSTAQLLAIRDAALLSLLVANPLRAKHLVTIGTQPGSCGYIHRDERGQWHITIPGAHFKNHKRVGSQLYNVPLPAWTRDVFDDYMLKVRPLLHARGDGQANEFFLNKQGRRFIGVGKHILRLTRRLLPETGGFGPHAARHLVGTDSLIHNPDDLLKVSELLNDSLEVVMKRYAHLDRTHAFRRHEHRINKLLGRDDKDDPEPAFC